MSNEYLAIASEIRELEKLLSTIPESNTIERMSLQSRLESAKTILAKLPRQAVPKMYLIFRGRPVFKNRGIAVDFGSRAVEAFSAAFAAGLIEQPSSTSCISDQDKSQLLITGTAAGLFGFEFELSVLSPEPEEIQRAISKMEVLLRLSAEGSDDDLADAIEDTHPHTVKRVHEFLELLVQHRARFDLEFEGRSFHYTDYEQVKTSYERLKDENIQKREETYQGEFQGVLPAGRLFEFRPVDQAGLIRGKIHPAIENPDVLNREWLHRPVVVRLSVLQVGQSCPRFTLMSLYDLQASR